MRIYEQREKNQTETVRKNTTYRKEIKKGTELGILQIQQKLLRGEQQSLGEKEIDKRTGKRKTNKNRKRKDMIKTLKQKRI